MPRRKRYRAIVGIEFPTDPAIIKRIQEARDGKGEKVPYEERNVTRVEAGDTSTLFPLVSVSWLLKQGKIEEVIGNGQV